MLVGVPLKRLREAARGVCLPPVCSGWCLSHTAWEKSLCRRWGPPSRSPSAPRTFLSLRRDRLGKKKKNININHQISLSTMNAALSNVKLYILWWSITVPKKSVTLSVTTLDALMTALSLSSYFIFISKNPEGNNRTETDEDRLSDIKCEWFLSLRGIKCAAVAAQRHLSCTSLLCKLLDRVWRHLLPLKETTHVHTPGDLWYNTNSTAPELINPGDFLTVENYVIVLEVLPLLEPLWILVEHDTHILSATGNKKENHFHR